MKNLLTLPAILLLGSAPLPAAEPGNHALFFNGMEDQVDLFMAPLMKEWTVSAWINKTGEPREDEVIVGNGWITTKGWEDYPLCLHKGKLSSYRTGLFAAEVLTPGWHHVASTWDGRTTTLYLDGDVVARKEGGGPICPNFIGSDDGKEFFGGFIDEVQIWSKALSQQTLKKWSGRPVDSTHPSYDDLVAYYRFDDRATDATDYKGDNKADRKIHYKSRSNSLGPAYVPNDNKAFTIPREPMRHLSTRALRSTLGARPGDKEVEILKLRINVEGNESPLRLDALKLDLSKCSNLADIGALHVYTLGHNAEPDVRQPLFKNSIAAENQIVLKQPVGALLKPGINYFAVTVDLKPTAIPGNLLHASCEGISLSGKVIKPVSVPPDAGRTILALTKSPTTLKVLDWNIWHGGIEKGRDVGSAQIVEIIKASDADVVTMVETYGSGPLIAEKLGFHFHETGPGSNLSILSRYPITETYKSNKGSFNSTGVKVKLDTGKEALIWCIWLRYWGGDYTITQHLRNYEAVNEWIEGDNKYPVADIQEILTKDLAVFHDGKMPLIVAGDFNSCSHLDFTKRAAEAGLHNGWVVDFPTAKEMLRQGFKDSYREVNPDEVTHPGGTWAAIYKWCQDFRIDYIYYKGEGIKAVKSRTIGEHVNADVLWPGDHGAVLTEFELAK